MTQIVPKINASPTKEFFVNVLKRDVTLDVAISEFIDNSIDGARKVNTNSGLSNFSIDIKFDKNSFTIKDNCGGIPNEIAENYAFRFGRTKIRTDATPHLPIGQFGVGMKRSLFVIGDFFTIESISQNSKFSMEVDVLGWMSSTRLDNDGQEIWEFDFKNYETNQNNLLANCGTTIVITSLDENVSADFQTQNFLNRLKVKIESDHSEALRSGLRVKINDIELNGHKDELLKSKDITPFYKKLTFGKQSNSVVAKIYAGISTKNKENFGWHVYCNGRQVLKADKTRLTGWGLAADEVSVPKSHTQFDRFRGYVYFESENASLLPWNTTKSGINENSGIYQSVRLEMILALRQVVDFLNQLDKETDTEQKPLNEMVGKALSANVSDMTPRSSIFKFSPPKIEVSKMQTISYKKPIKEIERTRKILNEKGKDARTNESVGSLTFNYFLDLEDEP